MKKFLIVSATAVGLSVGLLGLEQWRRWIVWNDTSTIESIDDTTRVQSGEPSLPALDAYGVNGIREITRPELVKLMEKSRPLSREENANLDRGCPGLTCVYQGLGLKRWPEAARSTRAYLTLEDALNRQCSNGRDNFVFLKQGCWLTGKPPTPDSITGAVPLSLLVRGKPGWYAFNYAVYFPSTATYLWMNHRNHRFPLNHLKPQLAYLSLVPPPLDKEARTAQIYCSTCR